MATRRATATSKKETGDTLLAWTVDEYPPHDRGLWWNVGAVVIGLGLLIYSFVTFNFLFALIVVIFGIILVFSASRKPGKIPFSVTRSGVQIGEQATLFRDVSRFWIVYEPGDIKCLYLEFKGFFRPHLSVPLEDQDPNEVRRVLKRFVDEDMERHDEPLSDYLGRVLKL